MIHYLYNENRNKYIHIILLLSFLLFQSFAVAQTGSIKGRVTDKNTNDPLVGANILVQGTNLGSAADIDGNFVIHNVASGKQVLNISYIGYKNLTLNVTITANQTNEINIKLEAVALEGKTIVVTAQAKGQLQAINQQLSSNNIVNVVSAEKMQELPDANIAESIGRLPGISLQRNAGEANAVVVRGLSPRYNEVTIEGVPMGSTSYQSLSQKSAGSFYQDRSIDLSLLSDDLVKGVEVSKTLRPDMDADALGGTINLTLKTAPKDLHFGLNANGAYNHLRDSYNNYKFVGNISNRFLDDRFGVLLQASIEEKQLPSDQFNANYTLNSPATAGGPNFITTTSAQLLETTTKRSRYGINLVLDYASDFVDVKFLNTYDQKKDSSISRGNTTNFGNNSFVDQIFIDETKTEQRTHSIQALFKFNGTELPVSISYTKGDQHTPNGQEFYFQQTGVLAKPISTNTATYAEPSVLIGIQGVMDPNNVNTVLWNLYQSNASLTDESFDYKFDWKVPFKYSDDLSGKLSVGGKYHSTKRESENTRVYYNVQWGGSQGRRDTLQNNISYLHNVNMHLSTGGVPAYVFVDKSYSRTNILGYPVGPGYNVYQLSSLLNTINSQWYSLYYQDGVQDFNQDYTDKESILAGYLMGEFNIGSHLSVVIGARYQEEKTDISAYHVQLNGSNQNGLAGQAPTLYNSKRTTPDWYPSINLKYKATDNFQAVGAIYKSVSLPSYSDISPLVEYAQNVQIVSGNPMLKPSTAWNFDLGASWFNNDIGLFTVNLFYKDISNLIYGMQNYYPFAPYPVIGAPSDIWERLPGKNYYDTTWAKTNSGTKLTASIPMNNPDDAYLRGIEISWQTHLWYLPGVLSGIVLDLNASWMSSNQMYPSFKVIGPLVGNKDTLLYTTRSGALQDQPKAIYNAMIGWDYKGFSSRFSIRYQQKTLSSLDTRNNLQDYYSDNLTLIDISLKQQIIDNFSVFANATNINDHIDKAYFEHPTYVTNSSTYYAGTLPTSAQTYSWIIQLGISYTY